VGHLRQHIFKEENVLFRMGEGVMSSEDHTTSTSCYERTEEERVGKDKHDEMLRLAKQIQSQA
jgi:hemerythrin-like domain-containing protein